MRGFSLLVAPATSLCLILFVASVQASSAAPSAVQIVRVDVGLAGHYKAGHWAPVRVTLRGGSEPVRGQLSIAVPDGDGVPSRVWTPPDRPVELKPGQETTVTLFGRFGRLGSEMSVDFRCGETRIAERSFRSSSVLENGGYSPALPSTWRLIAAVAGKPAGLEDAVKVLDEEADEKTVAFRMDAVSLLPGQWYGLESLDALVLSASDPELYADLRPDGPEVEALDRWVRMGGKLLIAAGSQADNAFQEGSALARFIPGRLERMISLRQGGALEAYAGGGVAVPRGPGGRIELRVPQFSETKGVVETKEGNLPLVVRRAWGFGQVVFLAADLDTAPLADWPDRGLLVARLLDLAPDIGDELREGSAMMHYGFTDMSGQLRRALDQFDGVAPFSFWIVAALIGGYILAIGPVDYFLLRRLSPRMELTWLTFPLLVVGFCALAYFLGTRYKGEEIRVNQVTLMDFDAETKQVRGTWWANVFSPRMDRYDLGCNPAANADEDSTGRTLFSWLGLPGQGLGGMEPAAAGLINVRQPYTFSPDLSAAAGVPIQIWATKSFTSRWHGPAGAVPEAKLADEDGVPVGTIINTLDFPLEDCLLAYGRWSYQVGTLEPGQAARVGAMVPRRELRTLLTGRRIVREEGTDKFQQEATPYDASSTDPAYILRTMMFFESAGGRRYTGLMNRYQSFVDLTSLLKTDRAVLVASVPDASERPAASLLLDGEPVADARGRNVSVCRFVFPVAPDKARRATPLFRKDKP
ncbi:MAG: hypothetical protein HUU20_11365 [Pirellulales bacterium]|nr:hypothetical protein [Pirellulales bacterium]